MLEMLKEIQKLKDLQIKGPLNNYLGLEIGGNIAGPMAAEEFARNGALIIKMELKEGDPARSYLTKETFTSCNAGKASIVFDKNNEQDQKIYRALLNLANFIIDNRSSRARNQDKILQFFLKEENQSEHLPIYCAIVGYGGKNESGALDITIQSETGMAVVNGTSPSQPLKVGFVVIDVTTGMHAASEIKSHLLGIANNISPSYNPSIDDKPKGVICIEISMAKVAGMLLMGQYLKANLTGQDAFREGNRDLWIAPFSFYKTQNSLISLSIIGDKQFAQFCKSVLEDETLTSKYPTNEDRLKNVDAFEKALSQKLSQKTSEEWIKRCAKYTIPCSKVNTITQALASFGKMMLDETKEGTTIMSNPGISSYYERGHDYHVNKMRKAPDLDEHRTPILALIQLSDICKSHRFDQIMGKHYHDFCSRKSS